MNGEIDKIKTGVGVLLKGKPGRGKGLISEHILQVYGLKYCFPLEDIAQLNGQFNKHLNESLFLVLEEVGFASNSRDVNKMKNKTTGIRCVTNEKFEKTQSNRMRYYNTQEHSNEDKARHKEMGYRHVMIQRTSDKYCTIGRSTIGVSPP